jgi:hypothetical protein
MKTDEEFRLIVELNRNLMAQRDTLKQDLGEAQARIDELMIEHCPNEVTPEQWAEYERCQRAVSDDELRKRLTSLNQIAARRDPYPDIPWKKDPLSLSTVTNLLAIVAVLVLVYLLHSANRIPV